MEYSRTKAGEEARGEREASTNGIKLHANGEAWRISYQHINNEK